MRGTAASRISAWGTLVAATVTVPLDSTSVRLPVWMRFLRKLLRFQGPGWLLFPQRVLMLPSGWADVPVLEEPQAVNKPAVRTAASANDNAFFFIMSPPFMKYHRPCICIVSPWCLGTGAWLI